MELGYKMGEKKKAIAPTPRWAATDSSAVPSQPHWCFLANHPIFLYHIGKEGIVCHCECLIRWRKETLSLMEANGRISNENPY